MDEETAWRVIEQERRALAALLRRLTPEQWSAASLCEGWSVRDVAAHVSGWPDTSLRQSAVALWTARGSFNRMIDLEARRRARQPTTQIVEVIERLAGSRRHPPMVGHHEEALVDVLVHTQDIALPLGIRHDMPVDAAAHCAARCWRVSYPFWARRRLAGLRLEATDVGWAAGQGEPLRGPIAALLLLITGRYAAVDRLSGPGAARLSSLSR